MTESEALELGKKLQANITSNANNTIKTDDYNEFVGMAIKALEKQIPNKANDEIKTIPILDENGAYIDADISVILLCPICGNQVGIDDCIDNYCSKCGQKLDWGDEE